MLPKKTFRNQLKRSKLWTHVTENYYLDNSAKFDKKWLRQRVRFYLNGIPRVFRSNRILKRKGYLQSNLLSYFIRNSGIRSISLDRHKTKIFEYSLESKLYNLKSYNKGKKQIKLSVQYSKFNYINAGSTLKDTEKQELFYMLSKGYRRIVLKFKNKKSLGFNFNRLLFNLVHIKNIKSIKKKYNLYSTVNQKQFYNINLSNTIPNSGYKTLSFNSRKIPIFRRSYSIFFKKLIKKQIYNLSQSQNPKIIKINTKTINIPSYLKLSNSKIKKPRLNRISRIIKRKLRKITVNAVKLVNLTAFTEKVRYRKRGKRTKRHSYDSNQLIPAKFVTPANFKCNALNSAKFDNFHANTLLLLFSSVLKSFSDSHFNLENSNAYGFRRKKIVRILIKKRKRRRKKRYIKRVARLHKFAGQKIFSQISLYTSKREVFRRFRGSLIKNGKASYANRILENMIFNLKTYSIKSYNLSLLFLRLLRTVKPVFTTKPKSKGGAILRMPAILNPRRAVSLGQRNFLASAMSRSDRGVNNKLNLELIDLYKGRYCLTRKVYDDHIKQALINRVLL